MEIEKILNNAKRIGNKIAVPLFSFSLGVGVGAIGKHTNHHEIPAIPIVADIFWGSIGKNHIIPYLSYGVGVAMNYLPEIYQALQNSTN